MRRNRLLLLALVPLLLPRAAFGSASSFGLFQHGARAIGQAGAFTARASDPSAVFYNPAAITQLACLAADGGLDMHNPTISYNSDSGRFEARHIIQFPPSLYVTWKPKSG